MAKKVFLEAIQKNYIDRWHTGCHLDVQATEREADV